MSIATSRMQRRLMARQSAKQPSRMEPIPRHEWPPSRAGEPVSAWRSREFLAQLYEDGEALRLSVNRTELDGDRWRDGITWDELQRVKAEIGFASRWMVEIYPPDSEVVNVANVRHLWMLPAAPEFGWKRRAQPVAQETSAVVDA